MASQFRVVFQIAFALAFIALIALGRSMPGHGFRNAFVGLVVAAVVFDLAFKKRAL